MNPHLGRQLNVLGRRLPPRKSSGSAFKTASRSEAQPHRSDTPCTPASRATAAPAVAETAESHPPAEPAEQPAQSHLPLLQSAASSPAHTRQTARCPSPPLPSTPAQIRQALPPQPPHRHHGQPATSSKTHSSSCSRRTAASHGEPSQTSFSQSTPRPPTQKTSPSHGPHPCGSNRSSHQPPRYTHPNCTPK